MAVNDEAMNVGLKSSTVICQLLLQKSNSSKTKRVALKSAIRNGLKCGECIQRLHIALSFKLAKMASTCIRAARTRNPEHRTVILHATAKMCAESIIIADCNDCSCIAGLQRGSYARIVSLFIVQTTPRMLPSSVFFFTLLQRWSSTSSHMAMGVESNMK
ncbi:hypothetical protein GJ496_000394 [Pomphorhynchus laevis]|nr:hypothetical protein GJ496_000394 [Pomphorhynchus laevis]